LLSSTSEIDYLPYPTDPSASHLEVPYICEEILKFSGDEEASAFISQKQKLSEAKIQYFTDSKLDMARCQAFVYFSLLETIYGTFKKAFDLGEYLNKENCTVLVTLKPLIIYINQQDFSNN
jgi:hypothetical protein